ncbi:O-antigen ligase family protein [Massilia sp. B-10]|nr:O-antigen ligase family protein [Massilia sp. B-10]
MQTADPPSSNVGIRLALWKEASLLVSAHPLFGLDRVDAKREERALVDGGLVDPVVLDAVHFHNDALQVLVTGGVALLRALAGDTARTAGILLAPAAPEGAGGLGLRRALALA